MFTFIETALFTRLVYDYLTDEEYAALQAHLLEQPLAGDVIPGSGGIRKIRWGQQGRGKRGGVRVIYFFADGAGLSGCLLSMRRTKRRTSPVMF